MNNNKGLAISGVIYTTLVLFLAILFSILMVLINRRGLFKNLYDDTIDFLENEYTQYRLISKSDFCGAEGTGYDSVECGDLDINYTDYSEKELIEVTPYTINKINNQGLLEDEYNLTLENATASVEKGIGIVNFTSPTTLSSSLKEGSSIEYKSIYLELNLSSCGTIFTFGENSNIVLEGNNTTCSNLILSNNSNTVSSTDLNYELGTTLKLMIIYDDETNVYNIISNGRKLTTVTALAPYNTILIDEFNLNDLLGKLHDLRISSAVISEYEAINITKGKYDLDFKMNNLNTEMIYKVIEYK